MSAEIPSNLENKIDRREFLEETGAAVGGIMIAPGIANILAEKNSSGDTSPEMKEKEHKRQEIQKAIKARAEFQRDPLKWIEKHRDTLIVSDPKSVQYCVCCVDEGDDLQISLPNEFAQEVPDNFDTISVPGSGVTYTKLDKDIKSLGLNVKGTTSHHECGACGGDDDKAEYIAKKLAGPDELDVEYIGMVHNLQRPEFHIALGSHVRYTPRIRNVRFAEGAPRYFDVSQFAVKDRNARVKNMALTLKITFHSEMGFHDLIAKEGAPFELCSYYDPKDLYNTKELVEEEMDDAIREAEIDPALKEEVLRRNLIQKRLIPILGE